MAFIIDDKKSDNQTVTSTPLTSGNSTPAPNTQPQNQSSTSTSPAQGQSTSPQPPPPPKKSSGSGMFTNIQKYVEKNKPKATEMGQSSLDAIRKAGEDAKSAQTEALSNFNTRATEGGLHDTEARVGQLEDYTRDQAGFNGQPSSQPQEAASTATQDIADYNSELKNRYYQGKEIGEHWYNGPTPVTFEEWRDKFEPNYQDRINEINSSYQTQDIPAVDPTVSSNGVGQPMIDERRFQEIINATYGGPRSLVETGNIYRDLAEQAAESARYGENVQSEQGRKQFLKDVFSEDGKDYGSGLANLDEYILGKAGDTPGQYLQQLMDEGKSIGSEQDILREVSRKATDIASGYESDIATTREQARAKFSDIADERQGEINTRINEVIENWDNLPAHFREIFSNPDGTVNLSAVEAGILGVLGGEGYYNLKGDDLFANKGEEGYIDPVSGKLITKQESGNLQRLKALSNMAITQNDLFNIKEDYSNTDQAGSQSALDALNLDRVRNKMAEAEEGFRKFADEDLSIIGKGEHGYKTGVLKTGKRKYAKKSYGGDRKYDLKEAIGDKYDWDSDVIDEQTGNADILKDMGNYYQNAENYQDTEGYGDNINMGSGSEMYDEGFFESAGYNSLAPLEEGGKFFSETVDNPFEGVYQIGENLDGIPIVGDMIKAIGELGGGGEKRKAERKAMEKAQRDFKSKYKNTMDSRIEQSGIGNRIGVTDDAETRARFEKLKELMKNTDLSNT